MYYDKQNKLISLRKNKLKQLQFPIKKTKSLPPTQKYNFWADLILVNLFKKKQNSENAKKKEMHSKLTIKEEKPYFYSIFSFRRPLQVCVLRGACCEHELVCAN